MKSYTLTIINPAANTDTVIAKQSARRVRLEVYPSGYVVSNEAFIAPNVMTAANQGVLLFNSTSGVTVYSPFIVDRELHGKIIEQDWHVWVIVASSGLAVVEVFDTPDSLPPFPG